MDFCIVQEGNKLPRGSIKLELKKLKLHSLQAQLRSQVLTICLSGPLQTHLDSLARKRKASDDSSAFLAIHATCLTPWRDIAEGLDS